MNKVQKLPPRLGLALDRRENRPKLRERWDPHLKKCHLPQLTSYWMPTSKLAVP